MKNISMILIAVLAISFSVSAQSTADSIKAKYQLQAMPEALTLEKSFPVIGSYQYTTPDGVNQTVLVSLDPENKGVVWVDGLAEGKLKAYLKKSPGTYRIISQKSESGKQVGEGTLIFDASTNSLNIAIGKKFDDADPAAIFNMGGAVDADVASTSEVKVKTKNSSGNKTKSKVVFYNATKVGGTTTAVMP